MYGGFLITNAMYLFKPSITTTVGSTNVDLRIDSNSSGFTGRLLGVLLVFIKDSDKISSISDYMSLTKKNAILTESYNTFLVVGLRSLSSRRMELTNLKLSTDMKSITSTYDPTVFILSYSCVVVTDLTIPAPPVSNLVVSMSTSQTNTSTQIQTQLRPVGSSPREYDPPESYYNFNLTTIVSNSFSNATFELIY